MIAPNVVAEVRRLLTEGGHSQRKIAHLMGVSRGTVAAISSGRRPDYEKRRGEVVERPVGPPKRCPGCGGMVYMPCLLCRARERSAENRRLSSRLRVAPAMESGLNLRPEHYARYQQVRDWRRRNQGRPFRGANE